MGVNETQAVRDYGWLVEKLARTYVRAGVEVDDLKQEGFLGLLEAARTWRTDGGSSFKSWASLAIRKYICRYGLATLETAAEEVSFDACADGATLHDSVGEAATQEEELGDAETRKVVRDAVGLLPAEDRALVYATMRGDTHEKIATDLGIGRQTVTDRYGQTTQKLTRLLKHRVEMGAPRAA